MRDGLTGSVGQVRQGRAVIGASMAEIVDRPGGVTPHGRIATSSREQASGVRQVYQAIA